MESGARRDEETLVRLYVEFAEEDVKLAHLGMADYAADLGREGAS